MDFSRFVGLPFKDGGRDYDGVDCWGLVWLFYRDMLEIALPSYADKSAHRLRGNAPFIATESKDHWRKAEAPQDGDAVLMRTLGLPAHIGVWCGDGRILHVEDGIDSVIEHETSPGLNGRGLGCYRPVP